jgi:hypothetical protein
VEQWRVALAAANVPLTEEQRQSLVTSIVAEQQQWWTASARPPYSTSGEPPTQQELAKQSLNSTTERHLRMLEVAQPHLNPEQATALRAALDQQLNLSRAAMRVQREQNVRSP